MTNWVYIRSEPGLWTVGFYDPTDKWESDSDHSDREEAAKRVNYLNGGRNQYGDKAFNDAVGFLISSSETRLDQFKGVVMGKDPDTLTEELWEMGVDEAGYLAKLLGDAIKVTRDFREINK